MKKRRLIVERNDLVIAGYTVCYCFLIKTTLKEDFLAMAFTLSHLAISVRALLLPLCPRRGKVKIGM